MPDGFDRHGRDFDYQKGELRERCQVGVLFRACNPSGAPTIQLEAEAKAAAGALIGSGAYSEGRSQGMASKPMAKKKLWKVA